MLGEIHGIGIIVGLICLPIVTGFIVVRRKRQLDGGDYAALFATVVIIVMWPVMLVCAVIFATIAGIVWVLFRIGKWLAQYYTSRTPERIMLVEHGSQYEAAGRLPHWLLPGGGYLAVLMEAYMDESVPEVGGPSPFMTVGGYLYTAKQASMLSAHWAAYLKDRGLDFYRTVDCLHGEGQFEGWDVGQRDAVARSLINRVKQKSEFGFAVSIDHAEHEAIFSKYVEMPNAYATACFACMIIIRRWADRNDYNGDIAYTFEEGTEGWKQARAFLDGIFDKPKNKPPYRHLSHLFAPKEKFPLLQSGDLIAYHTMKGFRSLAEGRPIRKDFQFLLRTGDRAMHYDKAELLRLEAMLLEAGNLTLKSV